MDKILKDHIARSWPEKLVEHVKRENDEECKELIKKHLGKHCHEPMIAKVMREAASRGKDDIVRRLLADGVNADVRLKKEDPTAFECTLKPTFPNIDCSEVRRLLHENGAKISSPVFPSWTYWYGIDSTGKPNQRAPDPPIPEPLKDDTEADKYRGLIVEIYSPIQEQEIRNSGKPNSGNKFNAAGLESTENSSTQNDSSQSAGNASGKHNTCKKASYEIHRIAHPTVKELIEGKGPDGIMGDRPSKFPDTHYNRYRWIHLPMNHVSRPPFPF